MCLIEKLYNTPLIWTEIIIIFIMSIYHIVCGSLRILPDFNTYEFFNASPFFDFSLSADCKNKSYIIFHTWGGWKRYEHSFTDDTYTWKYYDETDITKINENCFCYTI